MFYPAKTSQELRMYSRSKTPPLKQREREKDTVVYQLSTPRKVKKSVKRLTRDTGKAAKNIEKNIVKT